MGTAGRSALEFRRCIRSAPRGACANRRHAPALKFAFVSHVDPHALRAARGRAGLTQHQLAHLVGVAGGERVSRWERGLSEPRPDILVRLAGALDLPPLALLSGDTETPDLRALRLAAGLTAREIARRAHVSKPTYERWEAGRWDRWPSKENLRSVARALSVNNAATIAAFELTRAAAKMGQSPDA